MTLSKNIFLKISYLISHSYYISKQLLVQILFFLFGGAKNVIDHHHQHSYPPFHQERFAKKLIMSFWPQYVQTQIYDHSIWGKS